MTRRKMWGLLTAVVVLGLVVIGCSSTSPIMYSSTPSPNFVILGEVTYSASSGGNTGFTSFLAEARKQYPGTDYIIDVMVDERHTTFLFIPIAHRYIYRGTAIRYR